MGALHEQETPEPFLCRASDNPGSFAELQTILACTSNSRFGQTTLQLLAWLVTAGATCFQRLDSVWLLVDGTDGQSRPST